MRTCTSKGVVELIAGSGLAGKSQLCVGTCVSFPFPDKLFFLNFSGFIESTVKEMTIFVFLLFLLFDVGFGWYNSDNFMLVSYILHRKLVFG